MKCNKCGNEAPINSKFCNICGEKLITENQIKEEIDVTEDNIETNDVIIDGIDGADNRTDDFSKANEWEINNEQTVFDEADDAPIFDVTDEKPKKPSYFKLLILLIISGVLVAVTALLINTFNGEDIEGQWVLEDRSMFSILNETYIEFEDGEADYYNGFFSHEEWEYKYNSFFDTLKLYKSPTNVTILHLEWIDKNTFMIISNGATFKRVAYDDADIFEDDYDESYDTGKAEYF